MSDKIKKLENFVTWAEKHIRGDEKGEAQVFLDRMFQGFGWDGLKEAGAQCEERVKNTNGGTSFADLVWKPIVVIEMKRRGANLAKHYSQAFTYWTRLVPNRPRYAILCNFDEFWIYDFETQLDVPVDVVTLSSLPTKFGAMNFMFPGDEQPYFGNHQEKVTRSAADKLAQCFNLMIGRGVERDLAQRFILQMLMALFAEDIGFLEPDFVTKLLEECNTPQQSHDLLGGLFTSMNVLGGVQGGRFKGVPYFNGGLFANPAYVEITSDEVLLLRGAAHFDWSKVRPEIFGTIFEHSLGKEARHASGAHYTNAVDIMKVVGPTIVAPWSALIESADTLGRLQELLARIESFTVLDPACGSGNFLYVAYREIKRLEARIYERMAAEYKSVDARQRPFGFVTARNFFGMDVNPFAIDIAKVTMMLAHKLSIDELHINEAGLPLDNLDQNFKVCDALIDEQGERTPWFSTDVIVGNPPFLGVKKMKPELGNAYVQRLRRAYPDIPGMADFCVYWFSRANEHIKECTEADLVSGRAGLVGTQNVRNNASRIGGLDKIAETGTIIDAVDNQPWSGEAVVHVSIANWVKTKDKAILPKFRRLWFVSQKQGQKKRRKAIGEASKIADLDMREVGHINSALSDRVDVSKAVRIAVNAEVVVCQGITPGDSGFVVSTEVKETMVASNARNIEVLKPYMIGDDMLGAGRSQRWLVDFGRMSIIQASAYKLPFEHIKMNVLPELEKKAQKKDSERVASIGSWWQHWRSRTELVTEIAKLKRYIACSRVTKRPLFEFVSSDVLPGDALQAFALDDDYSFGILQSRAHFAWFQAKCSNMKVDPRYTSESIFDTFTWPQDVTAGEVAKIVEAVRAIRDVRNAARADGLGLRELYKTTELPGENPLARVHAALDEAVMRAYKFNSRKDVLQQLLDLNESVATQIEDGGTVRGPGIPDLIKNSVDLRSDYCMI